MKCFGFILLLFCAGVFPSYAQLQFVQRMEVKTNWEDDDFIVLSKEEGVVAFRMVSESGFSRNRNLEYFTADLQLQSGGLRHLPVRDFFNLLGFDLDGGVLYVLFQKGEVPTNEKYMVGINLATGVTSEVPLHAILEMEMQEFFVLNGKAILMGSMEYRPVIQVFDISRQHVTTVQGIYEKDNHIIQMRKAPEFGGFDVVMSRRDRFKNKDVTILSFDTEGNKLREVEIDRLDDSSAEIIDGLLTASYGYNQSLIGPFSLKRGSAYHGMYFTHINEFGEFESHLYTLEDFENFYNYLPEKSRERRKRRLERRRAKGKSTPIHNTLATREILAQDGLFLVYNDYLVSSSRYRPRDGMYINNFYRMSPMVRSLGGFGGYYSPLWTNPYFRRGQNPTEYKFLSAQMMLIDETGEILWENALSLDNANRFNPGKFGEVSFDGQNLFFMYLDELELKLSHLKDGEVMLENEPFEIALIHENERLAETQDNSLNLMWWYQNYFLLSGKQRVRYQQDDGKEAIRDVYFLTKIKVEDIN